jgi:hypothetical protein
LRNVLDKFPETTMDDLKLMVVKMFSGVRHAGPRNVVTKEVRVYIALDETEFDSLEEAKMWNEALKDSQA